MIQDFIGKRLSTVAKWSVFLFFFLLFSPSYSQADEKAVLKVILNTVDKGTYFLILTEEGDVLFPSVSLKKLGFKEIPEKAGIAGEDHVSLKSLSPDVKFEINEKESALVISADPRLLERYTVGLGYKRPIDVVYTKKDSAFLNYYIDYGMEEGLDFKTLSLPWEIGVRVGDYFGYSNFSYTKTDTDDEFVRMMTNITRDNPKTLRRYILGDFFAFTGIMGGSGAFGGLSISKNFTMKPYFTKFAGLDLSGVLETPSEVEVYVNDVLVRREEFPAGEFEFSDLPVYSGAGDTTLVITDAYGRKESITTPFYFSRRLLKTGLHEYSYNLGFKRDEIGKKSFEYGDLTFMGFHRIGLSRSFTGGLRAEAARDILNAGPTATFVLAGAGEIETSLAFSRDNDRYGYGAFLSYLYRTKGISGRLSLKGYSRHYSNLNLAESDDKIDKIRFQGLIGLGLYKKTLGSISANYQITDRYTGTDSKRFSLFYTRTLTKNVHLYARVSRTIQDETVNEVLVGLRFLLGGRRSGSMDYRVNDGISTMTANIQKNPPRGPGLGYKFLVETKENDQESWKTSGHASVNYHAPYGIYSVDYRKNIDEDSYGLKLSGSAALINGSVYFSRPIKDSFALVKVDDIKGVKVYYSSQEVGTTNSSGETIVPDIISYHDNRLSLEPTDVPINYNILRIEKYITTPYRGGSIVKFDVEKLQAFEGRFFFIEKGVKKPAEYAGLEIRIDDRIIEAIVGKRGEFYLENLPFGTFPAKLFFEDKECFFDMVVPESDEMIVDMGEISCEIN